MYKHSDKFLELKEHWLKAYNCDLIRRVRVLLPAGYYSKKESYPVVYIHDGQNIFYDKESFSGHSWRIIQTIKKTDGLKDMIIVAIDNGGPRRIYEYGPWEINNKSYQSGESFGGGGYIYADFLMEVVKPYIDFHYRTKSEREYTAMCGSSLGGNLTAFMGIKYSHKIGNLGIFSLANWLNQKEFNHFLDNSSIDFNQRVYIQVGTQEGDDFDRLLLDGNMKQAYIDTSLDYYRKLIKAGLSIDNIRIDIVADGSHEERVWSESLPNCLKFFSQNW